MENANLKDVSSEQQRFFDDAQERISQYYEVSSDFVRENPTIAMIGGGLLIGLVGFFLGRITGNE